MKKRIFVLLLVLFTISVYVTAQEGVDMPTEVTISSVDPVSSEEGLSVGNLIWGFMNSSVGISVVVFILSVIAGKIFTAKPKWKKYIIKYGPQIMQAVKVAEKKIPDDTKNKGLGKLDTALGYLIEIEPKLKNAKEVDLKQALTAVHAKAESSGNLK